jgi:hypothetical protein
MLTNENIATNANITHKKTKNLLTSILIYIQAPYKDIMLAPNVGIAIVNNFITSIPSLWLHLLKQ